MIYSLKDNVTKVYILLATLYNPVVVSNKTKVIRKKPQPLSQEIDSIGKIFCLWVFLVVIFYVKTMI